MRRFFLLACTWRCPHRRRAHRRFPRRWPSWFVLDFWLVDVGPAEEGNLIGQAGFEQGVTVWQRGSWYPHSSRQRGPDDGHRGIRMEQQATGSSCDEARAPRPRGHRAGRRRHDDRARCSRATSNGIRPPSSTTGRDGQPRDRRSVAHASVAFPGYAWASSGLVAGRDPDNWITVGAAQQGVVVFKSRHLQRRAVRGRRSELRQQAQALGEPRQLRRRRQARATAARRRRREPESPSDGSISC